MDKDKTIAYIGLGSNLGNKEENIRRAIDLLKNKCKILKISPLYKTEPIGYKKQDWFLNCAVKIETSLKPRELLSFLKSIEKRMKRKRTIHPRTIDLDILFYGEKVLKEKDLIVPHPRLHERLFVLKPLYDICPDFVHPSLKKSIAETLSSLPNTQYVEFYKLL
jgi:2-amino-4-hydroxy-6-hydroxymethyldihydropteridine diphosphokinase